MLKSKSRECQLLKISNGSHHPFGSICEGLSWTPFSPHTHLLTESHHLPSCSPTPWRAHGADYSAVPQAQTLTAD